MVSINPHRNTSFDILKGIGIILVMFGHVLPTGFVHDLIYGFHMPLFFFCSGVFFKEKQLWEATLKDLKTLMIPYITFCLFLVVCSFVLVYFAGGEGPVFKPLDENCFVLYYTIWFLPCLFITRFLYRIISKFKNIAVITTLSGGGYLLAFVLQKKGINIPFFIDSALGMLLFYHFGFLFNKKGFANKRIPFWLSMSLLIVYSIFIWLVNPMVDIKENVFPIFLIVLSMVPIYALYQICCTFKSRFLSYCGMASLVIMGMHHPLFDLELPLLRMLHLPVFVEIIIVLGFTLFFTLLFYQLIIKYLPFLLGKTKKAH